MVETEREQRGVEHGWCVTRCKSGPCTEQCVVRKRWRVLKRVAVDTAVPRRIACVPTGYVRWAKARLGVLAVGLRRGGKADE